MNEKDIVLALREPASRGKENKYNIAYIENSKNQLKQGQIIHTLGKPPKENVI